MVGSYGCSVCRMNRVLMYDTSPSQHRVSSAQELEKEHFAHSTSYLDPYKEFRSGPQVA